MANSPSWVVASARIASFDFQKLQHSRAYDVLMRLPVLAWSLGAAAVAAQHLARFERETDPMMSDALFAVNTAMQLAMIAFLVTVAGTAVVRARPTSRARGVEPRISALIGTFLIPAVVFFPRRDLSVAEGMVSTLLLLGGNALAIFVLARLGRSFSIMPEARGLVTSGLYRYVRHPLYLAEMIASIGSVLQFLSVWTALLLAVQIAFQLRRMQNEESVLTKTFSEYAAYQQRTARIIPGIY